MSEDPVEYKTEEDWEAKARRYEAALSKVLQSFVSPANSYFREEREALLAVRTALGVNAPSPCNISQLEAGNESY